MCSSNYFNSNDEKREYCGVVGAYSKKGKNVAHVLYKAMVALQHRGQDAAGIVMWNNGFVEKKGIGLVCDIFKDVDLNNLNGSVGIAHVRYPTTGAGSINNVQPFKTNNIVISHNGQISNYKEICSGLKNKGFKFASSVDSEIVAYLIDEQIKKGRCIEDAIKNLMNVLDGAYSIVGLIKNTLIAFKDPNGIRPLVWGENDEYVLFASETVAFDINNIVYCGELGAGEFATIQNKKVKIKKIKKIAPRQCMFEYIYFSRPDSILNGKNVMEVRERLGIELANIHPAKVDVVIDVPDSARTAAMAYAHTLNLPYKEGLIKNRYVGRTFIMPTQKKRISAVKMKLNVVKGVVNGKKVVLVDDSIVRGTTLKEIISCVRKAGASEVHVRITCPPIRAPCFYGIDMSTYKELIAHTKTIEEIRKTICADSLRYNSIESIKRAIGMFICTGCINENYPTSYAKKLANEQKNVEK